MIPKKIHFCWFGGNPKSELILFCIDTWKKYLPDYEIVEWNENNFDLSICPFVKEAYAYKKWAFVSDYVRAYALYHHGGIYLDSDVEIRRSLDEFLHHGAFSGFEKKGMSFTALWGAQKGHHWPKAIMDDYEQKTFSTIPNTITVTELLQEKYGIDPNRDILQSYNNDIFIYPSTYFCVDIPNYAVHHFDGSWMTDKEQKISYKDFVFERYILNQFVKINNDPLRLIYIIFKEYGFKSLFRSLLKRLYQELTGKTKKKR